jgi:signal peptidase II
MPQSLIGDFLILEKSQNTGIAFGIKINQNLILLGTIILLFFVLKIVKKELDTTKKLSQASILLILAGAISNFMDRLTVGSVTDFISFNFWPSFNLADVFIVAGVLMIVVFYKKVKKA